MNVSEEDYHRNASWTLKIGVRIVITTAPNKESLVTDGHWCHYNRLLRVVIGVITIACYGWSLVSLQSLVTGGHWCHYNRLLRVVIGVIKIACYG